MYHLRAPGWEGRGQRAVVVFTGFLAGDVNLLRETCHMVKLGAKIRLTIS